MASSARIAAFKSGVGDLDDLKVAMADMDAPVKTGFRLLADGYRVENRLTYPRVEALLDTWVTGTTPWDNANQTATYRVKAHPVREVAFTVGAEVTVDYESSCTISATVTSANPVYSETVTYPVNFAFFPGQSKKTIATKNLHDIFINAISTIASDHGLNLAQCTITYNRSCADPNVTLMFSEDGTNPSTSDQAKVWAVLSAQASRAARTYTGSYALSVSVSAVAGLTPLTSDNVYALCVLRRPDGTVYAPLAHPAPTPIDVQAGDVQYVLTKTSAAPGNLVFGDGTTSTYNNLQGVWGEVLGTETSADQTVNVVFGTDTVRPLPSFGVASPCEYQLEIVSVTDNVIGCFQRSDGSRTDSTLNTSLVLTNDSGASVVLWVPEHRTVDVVWESPHVVYSGFCNGVGPLLEKSDGMVEVDVSRFAIGETTTNIAYHVALSKAYVRRQISFPFLWGDPEPIDVAFVSCAFDATSTDVFGPMPHDEAIRVFPRVVVSSEFAELKDCNVPYVAQVYASSSSVYVMPGEETHVATMPRPDVPTDMLLSPAPVLRAEGTVPGVQFYVRNVDADTIDVVAVVDRADLAWTPFAHGGYYYFNDEERYFFVEPVQVNVSPDPTVVVAGMMPNRAPVVVEDPANPSASFRQLENYIDGAPSIEVVEHLAGTGSDKLFIAYTDVNSLVVRGSSGPIAGISVDGNELTWSDGVFDVSETYEVRYKLTRSFVVDYRETDALLTFDAAYDGLVLTYENSDRLYRAMEHLSFDPCVNPFPGGFLRITDTLYPPKHLDVVVTPSLIQADGISPVNIFVTVYDVHDNPVEGETVRLSSHMGVMEDVTDLYGTVCFRLHASASVQDITLLASCGNVSRTALLRCC